MNIHDATEISYKNGYEAGVKEFADKLTDRISNAIEQSLDNPNGNTYFLTDVYKDIDNTLKELTESKGGAE